MFLIFAEEQWLIKLDIGLFEENVVREMKVEFKREDYLISMNFVIVLNVSLIECFGLERFSSSKKLFRVIGYVLQFILRLKEKVKSIGESQKFEDEFLMVKELEDIEVLWL